MLSLSDVRVVPQTLSDKSIVYDVVITDGDIELTIHAEDEGAATAIANEIREGATGFDTRCM